MLYYIVLVIGLCVAAAFYGIGLLVTRIERIEAMIEVIDEQLEEREHQKKETA